MSLFGTSDANKAANLKAEAESRPHDVSVNKLQELLSSSDAGACTDAAEALAIVAEEDPEAVRPITGDLRSLLNSDHKYTRASAAHALGIIAAAYPQAVQPAVDELHPLLTDSHGSARRSTATALGEVATEHPETVKPATNQLQLLLDDYDESTRGAAAFALAQVATEYPEAVRTAVDDIQPLLGSRHSTVRASAVLVLVEMATEHPRSVTCVMNELQTLLDDDHEIVRIRAARALAGVAKERPSDVRPAVADLCNLVSEGSMATRRVAVQALAWILEEYPDAVEQLAPLARALDDDDTRTAAKRALAAAAEGDTNRVREAVDSYAPDYTDEVLNEAGLASPARIEDLLSTAQSHLKEVDDHSAASEYDRAFAHCKKALTAAETARELARDTSTDRYDDVEAALDTARQRLDSIETKQEVYQQAANILTNLEERLATAREALKREAQREALNSLTDVSAELEETGDLIAEYDFPNLEQRLVALEDRCETLQREVSGTLASIPAEIPSVARQELAHSQIEECKHIGSGGNANVHLATATTDNGEVEVALKKPQTSGTLTIETAERMMQEAETWQQLDDHDHIVSVVEYGSDPLPWIAMEYMNAGHLGECAGEMDLPQKLWTAIAVTRGVRHAHTRGIAHLDLKPANILFRSVEDAWNVPKVADWGLSKHLLNHSKSMEGLSPHYAAPEQFAADEYGEADQVTDVYQLGAVFYELFTGRPPFEGQPFEVMKQIESAEPTPPSEIADVPAALDDILLRALATEKPERYEAVLLLRNDLQELRDSL